MTLKQQKNAPKKQKSRWRRFSGFLSHNPVLVTGVIISPAVVATTSLKSAIALSITMAIVTIPTLLLAAITKKYLPQWIRAPFYAIVACALLPLAAMPVGRLSPTIFDAIGMYFPLLAVNSVIFARSDKFTKRTHPVWALMDAVVYTLGFAAAVVLIGSIRELIGNNTLWGIAVPMPVKLSGALYPFFGFIVVAFLAAACRAIPAFWRRILRMHEESIRRDHEYEHALHREVSA